MMTTTGDPTLDAMLAGEWINPETGRRAEPIPFRDIGIMATTDGAEADLIGPLGLGRSLAVVSDPRTHDALGARVAQALRSIAAIDEVIVDFDVATMDAVRAVQDKTRHADSVVAVGSGTLQDLVKHATFLDGRRFVTFATAASMNGYTSITASISEGGFKQSLKSHTPEALYMDVGVAASAPAFLARAGIGDCLCRSTAQVDWRLSNALFGTPYFETPFLIQRDDEARLLRLAGGLDKGDREAIEVLYRSLTWTGLGTCFTGTSHHGSMSEHLVSHWIDMFAGDDHPGTLHGHQVGYAAISMSRLQNAIFRADTPPVIQPTVLDEAYMIERYGDEIGRFCVGEARAKALDESEARRVNDRLSDWDGFRAPLLEVMLPTETLVDALAACGGYTTAAQSGLPPALYGEALRHARDIRNRFSVLDIAADAGLLDGFADAETTLAGMTPPRGERA
jgi:glycerol-1-phosphate dehydrogenase [NAD(P)+]